ncbi:MAG: hypothetical protein DIU56_010455 [Pseudomonadota bacterium]|nr:MAG: hypothetical protein DIU56_06845 [Pseudomonadota bacterium]
MTRLASVVALAMLLSACGRSEPEPRRDWVIHSRVVFVTEDFASEREPLPRNAFRLWFPYVSGDLYGSSNVPDYARPELAEDYSFTLDLNRGHPGLLRSLEPTAFTYRQLSITPAEARFARLTPQILEADGIEQIGTVEWLDARTREPLMLIYFDRPATITGALGSPPQEFRYDIRATEPGYVWVRRQSNEAGFVFTTTERPEEVLLAVAPPRVRAAPQRTEE